MNDLKEIEQIPGFMLIFMYPKLSEMNKRAWGFIIVGENEYIFRVDLNHEKLCKMNDQITEIMLRFSGLMRLFDMGTINYDDLKSMSEKCLGACKYLLEVYKEEK